MFADNTVCRSSRPWRLCLRNSMDLTTAHDLHDWLASTQSKRRLKAKEGQKQKLGPSSVSCRISDRLARQWE